MTLSGDGSTLTCTAPAEGFNLESSCEPGACEDDESESGCEGVAPTIGASGRATCEVPAGAGAGGEGES